MKKHFHLCRLRFPGGLHLGQGREELARGQDLLHSDTLAAALYAAALQIWGSEVSREDFLDRFRLSSAFPFVKEDYYFPMPLAGAQLQIEGMSGAQARKKLKKIQWVQKRLWEELLKGKPRTLSSDELRGGGHFLGGEPWDMRNMRFSREVAHKVSLRPLPGEPLEEGYTSTPFVVEEWRPGEDAGLFFLIEFAGDAQAQAAMKEKFICLLHYLGDCGFGQRRTAGLGYFAFEMKRLELELPEPGSHSLSLSLFCPAPGELTEAALATGAWDLIRRDGYLASASEPELRHHRRKAIHFLREGSVLALPQLRGWCPDLRPDSVSHPVWREGRPLSVPIVIQPHSYSHERYPV